MDDESIINSDGTAYNGNWRAVLLAVTISILLILYGLGSTIGAIWRGIFG